MVIRRLRMSDWYAAFCQPRKEELAERNLLNQGYSVFLPRLATQRQRRGKWVDVIEPLFPRYLFVAPSSERQSLSPVRSTFGVNTLVRFGGRAVIVSEAIVTSLRRMHDSATGACVLRSQFKQGTAVQLRHGPLAGLEGVFQCEDGEGRALVLLEFLGKVNKIRVFRDWLAPAA